MSFKRLEWMLSAWKALQRGRIGTIPNYFYTSIMFRLPLYNEQHTAMINTNRERLNHLYFVQPLIYVIRRVCY